MQLQSQETFFLDNNTAALAEARSKIRIFFTGTFSSSDMLKVVQSADEALANILEHGINSSPGEKIRVDLKLFDRQIQIILTDNAPCFNPLKHPGINPAQSYDSGIDGGIGIHIFRNFMKSDYEALQPQGNRLTLSKEIPE